jgi:hypothetical protein
MTSQLQLAILLLLLLLLLIIIIIIIIRVIIIIIIMTGFLFNSEPYQVKGSFVEERIFMGSPEGKNHLHDLGVDGKIILKWILESWNGSELAGPVEPLRYMQRVATPD